MAKPRRRIKGFSRSCGSKQRFDTLEAAEKAAKRGRWDFMQAYKCRRKGCGGYHYGHPKGWLR
jgi:hypothetical protein